ncbi:alpha-galactosidase [Microbacterium sp. PRC9]|uniref:alpha-galactosidase n=1 Tax=Microbacterium sp. PRC9 TaxID=2962591 RepID=UPI0028811870|nr:alpha-galactosidase [Microbacterium sp. PRC9]MDT0144836.1 alpha-galactosidase [Microbacterium sp. PRC9]
MITGDGRARNTTRFTHTGVGSRLRYVSHDVLESDDEARIDIHQHDPVTGLSVVTTFVASPELSAARVRTSVHNRGTSAVVLEAISTVAIGALVGEDDDPRDVILHSGSGEQLAENRWTAAPAWSQAGLGDFGSVYNNQPGRGYISQIGTSTWTTVRALPVGMIEHPLSGYSVAWQIEHNGGWRWELDNERVGENAHALVLLGPTDLNHHWSEQLEPGDEFTTVPASFSVASTGSAGAVAAMTRHRRWIRRRRTADTGSVLVFNDFMNTISGDPTTEKLLPLIDAAAAAGAECFCIDAGWYDDTPEGDWWPSVGEWLPAARRFPDGGLARVTDAIRAHGMRVGIWVEPEVIGVHSPLASTLPTDAFLQRHGRRVREHDRYFLDLRHPAARAHLDATFDRLISEFGVGFFKLDYNVTPGPGTDFAAFSVGAGLLGHNRAHISWAERLRKRYPDVIFENCSSGAMRADFAMLEVFDIQSTSDQQDFQLYPPIAAGAPMQMLPEQAASWAYPQSWMTDEEIAFTMTTGLSGRLYMSGYLNRMDESQLALVHEAADVFKDIREDIARSVPEWPTRYPDWTDPVVTLLLRSSTRSLLFVWHRSDEFAVETTVDLGHGVKSSDIVALYPSTLPSWSLTDLGEGRIRFTPATAGHSARVYEIPGH